MIVTINRIITQYPKLSFLGCIGAGLKFLESKLHHINLNIGSTDLHFKELCLFYYKRSSVRLLKYENTP